MNKILIILLMILMPLTALAEIDVYNFKTPEQLKLYTKLTEELRCLVCQNQSLSASNAGLAKDLRKQTHDMVMKGKTYSQIIAYMTHRYGDFVIYKPPLKKTTLLLWLGPFLILVAGCLVLIITLLKQRRNTDELTMSEPLLTSHREKQ